MVFGISSDRWTDSDRAVSPVIGVILMVAITVILAAVIGQFVLGFSNQVENTPQASFTFEEQDNGDLQITHDGGDTLDASAVTVKVEGSPVPGVFSNNVSAGDTDTVAASELSEGDTVAVVYDSGNGETTTLAKHDYKE